jgi:hypothetical protein
VLITALWIVATVIVIVWIIQTLRDLWRVL